AVCRAARWVLPAGGCLVGPPRAAGREAPGRGPPLAGGGGARGGGARPRRGAGVPRGGSGPRRVQRLPRPPAPGSEGPRQVARPALAHDSKPRDNAKEVRRVRLNVTLYRVMAYGTGVILIVLGLFARARAVATH